MQWAKTTLKVVGSIIVALIVIAVAAGFLIDVNRYKPQIEEGVAKATGMALKINGPASLRFFPRFHFTVRDVLLSNRGSELFAAREMDATVRVSSFLLRRKMVIDKISLDSPRVKAEKLSNGEYNFQMTHARRARGSGRIKTVSVRNADFSYLDHITGSAMHLEGVDADIADVAWNLGAPDFNRFMRSINFHGNIRANAFTAPRIAASEIKLAIEDKQGVVRMDSTEATVFGGKITGSARADLRKPEPLIELNESGTRIDLAQLLSQGKGRVSGVADTKLQLSSSGRNQDAFLKNLNGSIQLSSKDFSTTIPIDEFSGQFKTGKILGLAQLGSALFPGAPVTGGVAGRVAGIAGTSPAPSEEKRTRGSLVSNWKIVKGIAQTQDVAISTPKSTIAFKGNVNIVTRRYEGFSIARVDDRGCALEQVPVEGSLFQPKPVLGAVAQGLAKERLKSLSPLGSSIAGALPGAEGGGQPPQAGAPACDQFVNPAMIPKAS